MSAVCEKRVKVEVINSRTGVEITKFWKVNRLLLKQNIVHPGSESKGFCALS